VNGEHKISSSHRGRAALACLRQSSMAQVRENTESTRSQYALADKAAALGWPRTSIDVIDTDLGISGKWGVAREGFTELVTRVCSGEVGAIFGIEITRLARSNADVARLAEFARITGTLLIDPDGVYDPADVNDRVLLGFKGTMGEALCRVRHKASYADHAVMTRSRSTDEVQPAHASWGRSLVRHNPATRSRTGRQGTRARTAGRILSSQVKSDFTAFSCECACPAGAASRPRRTTIMQASASRFPSGPAIPSSRSA
jgi:Resolvase, N terminal domain